MRILKQCGSSADADADANTRCISRLYYSHSLWYSGTVDYILGCITLTVFGTVVPYITFEVVLLSVFGTVVPYIIYWYTAMVLINTLVNIWLVN